MEWFIEWGYLGLFSAAFLAATLLPMGSELILAGLLQTDLNPTVLVLIATLGNVLGSVVNYVLGLWLGKAFIAKWLKLSDEAFEKAEMRFQKYGLASLLLAWVPIIGDPITLVAGILRLPIIWFLVLVTAGKLARYAVIAYFAV